MYPTADSNSVLLAVLLVLLHSAAVKSKGDEPYSDHGGMFVPLPDFNTELMTRDQCELQFTANCGVRTDVGNSFACAQNHGLAINCSGKATNEEVHQLALVLSRPPLKAVSFSLNDGPQITFDNLAPVREQTVVFHLRNCRSSRATKKLAQLLMPHLLEFSVHDCRALDVRRADFWPSSKLRSIQFANSTLESLEAGTFADLPGLRLLSLERGFRQMELFPEDVQAYLMRLHCGGEFEPFRLWWGVSGLLQQATEGSIYRIEYDSWKNEDLSKNDIFLPIDCAATPFPNGSAAIDFTMEVFSANEWLQAEKFCEDCANLTATNDAFPTFSSEPVTETECQILTIVRCYSVHRNFHSCKNYPFTPAKVEGQPEPDCNGAVQKREIRELATAMAKQRLRPTTLTMSQRWNITAADVSPVRRTMVNLYVFGCTDSRTTQIPRELRLNNLLYLEIMSCSDQAVQRSDFERLPKLRQLMFSNTTMVSLEMDAFSALPDLRLLVPEGDFFYRALVEGRFPQRARDYVWRLHCGCELAWFRQWWTNNTRLLHGVQTEAGEVWAILNYVRSDPLMRADVFLPIDCAQPFPRVAESINVTETAFSRHAEQCIGH
ncbi:uncharacterized protein LOC129594999 isoform X2 [Paramacrobiotus metropolitanus]|uniref:uncharacterized protein LOC129594999 isoform X2 n=1 Tax=Paramacrobiotus metropolitanus TaxID=2943436 RepID=UPI002445DFC0|nr:uncharacterized protein LOC129594999 isoform X2 [Paramacrobiotus metropolitanus]